MIENEVAKTVPNKGYSLLRLKFLIGFQSLFAIFRLQWKESCEFFRNELYTRTVVLHFKSNINQWQKSLEKLD